MASTASMRSSGVAGLSVGVSILFFSGSADIWVVTAMVANALWLSILLAGAAVGCVLMAAFV